MLGEAETESGTDCARSQDDLRSYNAGTCTEAQRTVSLHSVSHHILKYLAAEVVRAVVSM